MMYHPDLGRLLLRLTLGGLLLFHGLTKLFQGVGYIGQEIATYGLPAELAYLVFLGEILAPMMIILGYQTAVGAGLIIMNMIIAIGLVHRDDLLMISNTGGFGLELQVFYLMTAIVILLMGPGKYRLKN